MPVAHVYSDLKVLGFPDHLAALAAGRVPAPVHVRIKPINHCNHNCWYCAYRASNLQLGEHMDEADSIPAAKMTEIVDDLIAIGVKAVTFSGGGEPTLYKPLPDCVRRLAAGGIKVAALTNGSNLKGAFAAAFAEYGTWVRVSVDAWDDDSYARARGVNPGSFSKLLANMRAFAATGTVCTLGVSFIDACAAFKAASAAHVKISGAVVANDGHANNLYHRQIVAARDLEDDGFQIVDHYHERSERFDKPYRNCPFPRFLTVIGADCGVYACQDKAYTEAGRLGSLRTRRFREFWFSDENRERLAGIDPATACRHHCVADAKNRAILELLGMEPEHVAFV
ncbi:MAG: radical SAM/SPASM domain-containing protein [Alphaproteobacteria bacterium]